MLFDYKSEGTDKFGRTNPKIIVLKTDEIIIGHVYVRSTDKDETVIYFKKIEDIKDWRANKIALGTNKIIIKESEIKSVEDYKLDANEISINENEIKEKEYQIKNIESVFNAASFSPVFKPNPKYSTGQFAELTPYISYNDIMNFKFIIRACRIGEHNSFDAEEREIIAKYDDIESLVNDGWRLD